MINYLLHF